jgi:hypothetical protein
MEVAEIAARVAGAHDFDAHTDGPEGLLVDGLPERVLVGP